MFTRTAKKSGNMTMNKDQKRALAKFDAHKKARGRKQRKDAPSRATQDALGYRALYEDGTMQINDHEWSRTIQFKDVNYQTASREKQIDYFTQYGDLFNSIEGDSSIEITVRNERVDVNEFMAQSGFKKQGDGLDSLRQEMDDYMLSRLQDHGTSMIKEKYMTITTHGEDEQVALQDLGGMCDTVTDALHDMGSDAHVLDGAERLEVLNSSLRPGTRLHFSFEDLKYSGLTTHSVIAPTSLTFKDKKTFELGDKFAQIIYLRQYPTQLSDRLFRDITKIIGDLEVSVHIKPIAQDKAMNSVRLKTAMMNKEKSELQRKAIKDGYDPSILPADLDFKIKEADELLDQMREANQKLFAVTFLVMAKTDSEEDLRQLVTKIKTAANTSLCEMVNLDYLQKQALSSVLVIGKNYVPINRQLTTSAVAIMLPFTAQELTEPSGLLYGINQVTKNVITADRRKLKAGNGLVMGRPGAGKSFATKMEMISVALRDPDAEVLIIDPEREYPAVGEALNGQVVRISPGTKTFINPLEINESYGDDDDPVLLKTDFVTTVCELLIGGKEGLTSERRSLIDRACRIMYRDYFEGVSLDPVTGKQKNPDTKMPTLADFSRVLKSQPEPVGKQIAVELEPFIEGSLSSFAHQTNVDTSNRVMVFDVKDLGKNMRSFGMMVVLDEIWNHITANRREGKRTWIYVDEMQLLFTNQYASNYFFELWSRARKWGAIPTGITQNVETMLMSADAQRMLSNSEFVLLLDQATNDRDSLVELLKLSSHEAGYITNAKQGHGLLIAGQTTVPFENDFPKDTKLYKIMSTKPEDMDQYKKRSQAEDAN